MLTHAPAQAPGPRDQQAEASIAALRDAVQAIRGFRGDQNISPKVSLTVAIAADDPDAVPVDAFAAIAGVEIGDPGADALVVPMAGGRLLVKAPEVDPAVERARLEAAIASARTELARAEKQLGNERFTSRAPEHLVEAEREKARRFTAEVEELSARLDALG